MKWKQRIGLFILALTVGSIQVVPVLADGKSAIRIESENGSNGMTASCVMDETGTVTNGKIRIYYNPDELVLAETQAGEAVSGTLVQINDTLTGNKAPGEIVFVFANAEPLEVKGTLLHMEFEQGEQFDAEKGSEIQLSVEELALEGTELEVSAENGIVPGKTQNEPPANKPGKEEPDSPDDGEDKNRSSDGDENAEQDTERKENTDDPSKKASNSNAGGTKATSSVEQEAKTKIKTVKTGDEINIAVPMTAAVLALGTIGGLLIKKRKKRS